VILYGLVSNETFSQETGSQETWTGAFEIKVADQRLAKASQQSLSEESTGYMRLPVQRQFWKHYVKLDIL